MLFLMRYTLYKESIGIIDYFTITENPLINEKILNKINNGYKLLYTNLIHNSKNFEVLKDTLKYNLLYKRHEYNKNILISIPKKYTNTCSI